MKKIFTTKTSIQSSNSTHSYPIIRLPREMKTLAGKIVSIYETECEGEQAFFVVTQVDKLVDKSQETSIESRFISIESKIDELNNFLLKNNDDNPYELSKNSWKYLTLSTIGDRRGAKLLVRGRLSIRIEACQKKIQAHYIPTSYALTAAPLRTLLGAIVRSPICQIGKKRAAAAKISKS